MNVGYARVSTGDQNFDLQRDALLAAGCDESKVFTDKLSGAKDDRPGLAQALAYVRGRRHPGGLAFGQVRSESLTPDRGDDWL
jgi:DNA invertase Pin-like site-specific DNA recombinase